MKKNTLKSVLIIAFVIAMNIAFSQAPPPTKDGRRNKQNERRENIESMKIGFLTKKLNLTPEEAQKFWPIYNQYQDKMDDLRKKRRQDNREAKQNFDELSDKEVEQAVDNEILFRQKELEIQKEYHSKFKAVLPIKKVAKLYQAEEQFKRVLLDKLKDKPPVKD